MWKRVLQSIRMLAVFTFLTGLVYPLAMTGLAQVLFPGQANGSLITQQGQVVGSKLIGQNFINPGYFHGRPSAAGSDGYDAASSAGSNLGPTNEKLRTAVTDRIAQVRNENSLPNDQTIPSDLVLASASGLDPHISPEAAYLQIERIAQARGLTVTEIRNLIDIHTERRQLGFLGEPRVNVLELNLALDGIKR